MATTDSNEWRLFDTDLTTQKSILPTDKSHLYYVINEPGSGQLSIPLDSAAAADVTSGQFAMSYYRGAARNGFFIDNIKLNQADMSEGGGRWVSLSGRGAMALLEDAIVWDNGSTDSTRVFTDVTKASILKTLIDEAKARGGLTALTYDFSATVDSDAVAWTDSEDYSFNVGMTVLDVLRQFAKTGIDFDINYSAGTFVLSAYKNGLGTDKSETVYFRVGVNCVEVGSDERGDEIHNAYRVAYKTGSLTVANNTSIAARRRREKLLDARLAQTSTSASNYGAAILANYKDPQKGITVKIYDGVGPRVFEDYVMGDYIMLDVLGVETRYRILGIQCDFDGSQYSNVVVELNTLLLDNELKLTQSVDKLLTDWQTARDANLLDVRYWASIGDVTGTSIKALAVSDAGLLYVGGEFTNIGNIAANNFAIYDINTGIWYAVGTGMNDVVRSIVADGTTIYIGGDFTDANGVTVAYVTSLTEGTTTFDDMDGGSSTGVYAMSLNGTDLFITQNTGVAKWDGSSWTTYTPEDGLVDGIQDTVTLVIDDGILYIGGTIRFNGVDYYGAPLYKYNIASNAWTKLITTYSGSVKSLAVYNGYLYIGGLFTDIMSVSNTRGIGRIEISTGTISSLGFDIPLDGGFIRHPNSMVVVGADLIIGGDFPAIGNLSDAGYIVRFDGTTLTKLDTGLDDDVYAVTYDQNNLYGNIFAGGIFANAGEKPLVKIGEYINNFEALMDHLENSSGFDMAAAIHGAQAKNPIIGNDEIGFWNSVTGKLAKINFTNFLTSAQTFLATLFVSKTQTALRVLISDSAGAVGTTDKFIFEDTNETMTVGKVESGSIANFFFSFVTGASSLLNVYTWGSGFTTAFKGIFARGSKTSPTAVQSGDALVKFRGAGYDGTTAVGSAATSAEIRAVATENFSSSAHGAKFEILTTPNGGTTPALAATFGQDKSLAIVGAVSGSNLSGTNTGDQTIREILTAARTYYVRTDGNDSNTGLVNNSGGAFLTLQKAINVASGNLDIGIYDVTIQLAAGTYSTSVGNVLKTCVGSGKVIIIGDETTPANVVIHCTSTPALFLYEQAGTTYSLRGLKLTSTGSAAYGMRIRYGAALTFQNLNFGSLAGAQAIRADDNGIIEVTGNYAISGGCGFHILLNAGGRLRCQSKTITITGTPAWSGYFLYAAITATVIANGNTYSGSATGARYLVETNAVVYTTGGATYFPGNAAGSTATGGQYL